MIKNSACSSYKDVDSFSELIGLVRDADTSVNCDNLELISIMLDHVDLSSNLKRQLSCWSNHDGLHASSFEQLVLPQILHDRKCESKCLSRTSQISCNQIFSLVHWIKAMRLDGKEASETLIFHDLNCFIRDFWEV